MLHSYVVRPFVSLFVVSLVVKSNVHVSLGILGTVNSKLGSHRLIGISAQLLHSLVLASDSLQVLQIRILHTSNVLSVEHTHFKCLDVGHNGIGGDHGVCVGQTSLGEVLQGLVEDVIGSNLLGNVVLVSVVGN
jgi:hypothetical protein